MSSHFYKISRRLVLFVLTGFFISACTVQPLYQGGKGDANTLNVSPTIQQKLASINIDIPSDRFNQQVRNRLIFLLDGGAGLPNQPVYTLKIDTSYIVRTAVQVDIGDTTDHTGRASAGIIEARGKYVLMDGNGKVVAQRTRVATASFDRPRQEYANLSAEKEAIARAADELAQQVYLSLAQDVSKIK